MGIGAGRAAAATATHRRPSPPTADPVARPWETRTRTRARLHTRNALRVGSGYHILQRSNRCMDGCLYVYLYAAWARGRVGWKNR